MSASLDSRFTRDGSADLECHVARVCEQVRDGVMALIPQERIEGVLLGGGYGRGEGGVLRVAGSDQAYNDLEFYVLVRGWAPWVERKYRGPLHELGERLSPAAGLEVEFKVLTRAKLRQSPPSMFYYDLVLGHRWVVGDESLLVACEHHRDASRIPLHEATRLLMNRCSGLLYSAERLARKDFGPAEADFVGRNLAKAQMAFGDVVLAAHGQYHWSCLERQRRLAGLGATDGLPLPELRSHHAAGVEFKLHPMRSLQSREVLLERHVELTGLGQRLWLWLEGRRLGAGVGSDAIDYAFAPTNLCPETSALRNRLVNARAFGPGVAVVEGGSRYPRERLLRSLAVLLFRPAALQGDRSRAAVQCWLRTSAGDFRGLVEAYAGLWSRFN